MIATIRNVGIMARRKLIARNGSVITRGIWIVNIVISSMLVLKKREKNMRIGLIDDLKEI